MEIILYLGIPFQARQLIVFEKSVNIISFNELILLHKVFYNILLKHKTTTTDQTWPAYYIFFGTQNRGIAVIKHAMFF